MEINADCANCATGIDLQRLCRRPNFYGGCGWGLWVGVCGDLQGESAVISNTADGENFQEKKEEISNTYLVFMIFEKSARKCK